MASECSVLRLLPISGGIFAGNFLEEMPSLTWRAIGLAFARLPRQAQDALLEPIEGHVLGAVAAPTYIERFLEVCRQLNQGSTDSTKLKRIVHPHTEKVWTLSGIFADMDVVAGMYMCNAVRGD